MHLQAVSDVEITVFTKSNYVLTPGRGQPQSSGAF